MEIKRFRNHFSSVIEQFGAVLAVLVLIVLQSLDDIAEVAVDVSRADADAAIGVLVTVGIFLLLTIVFMIWRFWVWSRTWIIIENETITIEQNTLNSKKNTIGLKNVSNVNTEQNIFEMILGTCKVKLDTNSLSTANSTDVKIVLKKKQAEELRAYLVNRINEITNNVENSEILTELKDSDYDIKSNTKDIFLNGLYSINLLVVLILLGSIGGFVASIMELIESGVSAEGIGAVIGVIGVAFFMIVTTVSGLISGFLKLYGFMSKRDGDRIYIKYGLFKKVNYAIPVDKINAIIIHQTFIARIFRKYTAEMVNVGMDDEKDSNAFFTFYGSKEKLLEVVDKLLPEFSDAIQFEVNRQPKSVWIVKTIGFLVTIVIWSVIAVAANIVFEIPYWIGAIFVGCIAVIMLIHMIMAYVTTGTSIRKNYLGIRKGVFGTYYDIIQFDKIQYVTLKQNILTKSLGIIKGEAKILASLANQSHAIPYIKEEDCEKIEREMADWRN